MKTIDIYTDGSCYGHPGNGGWSALIVSGPIKFEISGSESKTTSNRMEMVAVIEALKVLKRRSIVNIYTDCEFIVDGFNNRMIEKWRRNGWRGKSRKQISNKDLWKEMHRLSRKHHVRFYHVKGHDGHVYNERCDASAKIAAKGESVS